MLKPSKNSNSLLPYKREAPSEPAPAEKKTPTPIDITKFSDLGGIDDILSDIQDLIINPIRRPEVFKELRIEPARGVLFVGPPGTGKTYLANAICSELGISFHKISAPEVVSGMSGESEQKLRDLFKEAQNSAPSVIFLDEIDAITPKRSAAAKEMEKRIVAQMITCLDSLGGFLEHGQLVLVLAATNRIDAIDPALRRAGRFDREIHFGIPNEIQRGKILEVLISKIKTRGEISSVQIAKMTPGYVGADLHSLVKEAGNIAIRRICTSSEEDPDLEQLYVELDDFVQAVDNVQPSSKREGFTTIPDTSWDDIGGLSDLRETLKYSIVHAISNPEQYAALGISSAAGVLLAGPPGCGKTLVAKAVAHESHANFIAVNGPELLNKYVGESEKAIRQLFQRARDSSPCIVFFDEIDSLCARRGSENAATERVVNQLLTELNGLTDRKAVYVIAATNRVDIIDPAILRPGRLDKILFVPLPNSDDRLSIVKTTLRKSPVAENVELESIVDGTEGFSGADLASLVREAAWQALRAEWSQIEQQHLTQALSIVKPSVSKEDLIEYLATKERYSR